MGRLAITAGSAEGGQKNRVRRGVCDQAARGDGGTRGAGQEHGDHGARPGAAQHQLAARRLDQVLGQEQAHAVPIGRRRHRRPASPTSTGPEAGTGRAASPSPSSSTATLKPPATGRALRATFPRPCFTELSIRMSRTWANEAGTEHSPNPDSETWKRRPDCARTGCHRRSAASRTSATGTVRPANPLAGVEPLRASRNSWSRVAWSRSTSPTASPMARSMSTPGVTRAFSSESRKRGQGRAQLVRRVGGERPFPAQEATEARRRRGHRMPGPGRSRRSPD